MSSSYPCYAHLSNPQQQVAQIYDQALLKISNHAKVVFVEGYAEGNDKVEDIDADDFKYTCIDGFSQLERWRNVDTTIPKLCVDVDLCDGIPPELKTQILAAIELVDWADKMVGMVLVNETRVDWICKSIQRYNEMREAITKIKGGPESITTIQDVRKKVAQLKGATGSRTGGGRDGKKEDGKDTTTSPPARETSGGGPSAGETSGKGPSAGETSGGGPPAGETPTKFQWPPGKKEEFELAERSREFFTFGANPGGGGHGIFPPGTMSFGTPEFAAYMSALAQGMSASAAGGSGVSAPLAGGKDISAPAAGGKDISAPAAGGKDMPAPAAGGKDISAPAAGGKDMPAPKATDTIKKRRGPAGKVPGASGDAGLSLKAKGGTDDFEEIESPEDTKKAVDEHLKAGGGKAGDKRRVR